MTIVRACAVLAMIAGCRSDGADLPVADLTAERFAARGRVTAVHARELEIHHERIEQIRTFEGKLEPMDPMTMVFAATTSAPIGGIAVGDPVRIEFTVHYKQPPTLRLVSIAKLAPDTPLSLP